jgi:hypothetical protein
MRKDMKHLVHVLGAFALMLMLALPAMAAGATVID